MILVFMPSKKASRKALNVALMYIIVAGCWILFSDKMLFWLLRNPDVQHEMELFKGCALCWRPASCSIPPCDVYWKDGNGRRSSANRPSFMLLGITRRQSSQNIHPGPSV